MNPWNWKNKGGKATPLGEGHRGARCAFSGEEMEGRRGMPETGRTHIPGAPMSGGERMAMTASAADWSAAETLSGKGGQCRSAGCPAPSAGGREPPASHSTTGGPR